MLKISRRPTALAIFIVMVLAFALLSAGTVSSAQAAADLQITGLNVAPDPAVAGGTYTYDITVANGGQDPALGSKVVLQLDANVSFVSSPACSATPGNTVTCDFGTVATLSSGATPITVQIVVAPGAAGSVTAVATVSTTSFDGNNANDTQQVITTVDAGADLFFQTLSAAPDPVTAGGFVSYNVVLGNNGPNTATGSTAKFTLPPGLNYDSESSANWSCSAAGSVVTCTSASNILSAGVSPPLTFKAKVVANTTGTLTVSATASSPLRDGNETNNTTTIDVAVVAGTDMTVSKTVDADPVIATSVVTFTLQATNLGPFTADSVQVSDDLPVGFTNVAASGAGWTCAVAPVVVGLDTVQNVTCTRPLQSVGAAPPIIVTATAPPNATIPATGRNESNTARVQTVTADPIPGNNSGAITFALKRNGADLTPTMSRAPSPVSINTDITSTIRVKNLGPRDATGQVGIQYELQPGEAYQSASGTNWSCAAPVGTIVTCTWSGAGPLIAGGASTPPLYVVTRVSGPGVSLSRVCTSTTAGFPPIESDINTGDGNDCVSRQTLVSAASADLLLQKTVDIPVLAPNANTITYTLTVTNNGPDASQNVILSDPIPMYSPAFNGRAATSVSGTISGGGTCTGTSTQTCNLGTIAANASKTVTITVDRPMVQGSWRNNAQVFSTVTGDPNRADNYAFADVTIDPVTDIEVTAKTVTPDPVRSGVEATYVISLRNNGPSPADNVVLSDVFTIAAGHGDFTFISAAGSDGATCGGYNAGTKTVACDFGTVPAFALRSMTVKIRPDFLAAPPVARQFSNTASAVTTTVENDATNNSKTTTLTIIPDLVDVTIAQKDLLDPVPFDAAAALDPTKNLIVYKIDVKNLGPSFATGVSYTDKYAQGAGRTLSFLCDVPTATAASTCAGVLPASQICAGGGGIGSAVTCSVGDLAASQSATRYLIYKVDSLPAVSGDTFIKTSVVTVNEVETLPLTNNTAEERTTVRVLADMELTSKVASPATVSLNEPFTWTVTLTNKGPGSADNVVLSDTLPATMVLTGAPTPSVGSCPTGASGQRIIKCNLGLLGNGAIATVTLPVKMISYPTGGSETNTASVATDSIDPVSGNNSGGGTVAVQRSSLTGEVYKDLNDDGVRGGGEGGIAGVTLKLTGKDFWGNVITRTVQTVGTGAYSFDNLPPSDGAGYTITQIQPAGYFDGQDNLAGTVIAGSKASDVLGPVVLGVNQAKTGYLFGELAQASIAGVVWYDQSNDGVLDGAEAQRIDGVTIALSGTDDLGQAVSLSTLTAGGGAYSFTGLRPGTYTLTQTQPASHLPGQAAIGTGATISAGTPDNTLAAASYGNVIAAIGLRSGDVASGYNFGELLKSSLAGTVYYDIDNSAAQNGTEPGIGGAAITLSGTDYRGNAVVAQNIQTNPDGSYSFANLLPGTYAITQSVQPVGYLDGQETIGSLGATLQPDSFTAIGVGSAQTGTGYDFGERSAGLSGTVFNDLNNDGTQQAGDTGISGVTITLAGCGVNRTIQTSATGSYQFNALPACLSGYTLTEGQPVGYSDGKETAGTAGGSIAINDTISGISLGATAFGSGYNFGEIQQVAADLSCAAAVTTAKNVNENFNLTFTVTNGGPGAAPASKFINTLTAGLELTGLPLPAQGSCIGLAGATSFSCDLGFLGNGQTAAITVPVSIASYPPGGTATSTGGVSTDGNDGNGSNNNCAAAVPVRATTISGVVYDDLSNDGVKAGTEAGIGGVVMTLTGTDLYNNPVSLTVPTQPDGSYSFTGLAPANAAGYTLTQTQPGAYLPGLASVGTGTSGGAGGADNALASANYGNVISGIGLAGGDTGVSYNFGELQTGSIAGAVYFDIDNSGARNGTEPGIGAVTLNLTGTDYRGQAVSRSVVTNAAVPLGDYLFDALAPGTYAIAQVQPATYTDGGETLGTLNGAVGPDTFTAIVVGSKIAGTGYNFGELRAGLEGTVYNDINNDGIQQVGEVGIAGVTINLSGCTTRTVQTNAAGKYQIGDLPACPTGYTLTQTQPAGFSDGKETAGTAGGNTAVNDAISNIVLAQTDYATGYNFGEHQINATDMACTTPALTAKNINEPFDLVFTFTNNGPGNAPATKIADTLPAGMELTAAPTTSFGSCTGAPGGPSYSCDLGYVPVGTVVNVTAPVQVVSYPATGTVTNVAAVTTDGLDGTAGNNNCTSPVTIRQSVVGGTIFEDTDNNGVKNGAEPPIAGVTLTLTGTDLYGNAVNVTVISKPDGTYSFAGLPPSDATGYTLSETQPGGFADGIDTVGDKGGVLANDVISQIVLGPGIIGAGYDFAEISQGLSGSVYVDKNNNGVRDIGEPGIANASVSVTGTDINGALVNATVQTGTDGTYFFGGLQPSNPAGYVLRETQPAAWADGLDKIGSAGGTLGNDQISALVLPAGKITTGYDFGERGASLCGAVYSDLNNDGVRAANEIGIPAVSLTLSGTDIDDNVISVTTTTQDLTLAAGDLGRYCFNDLPLPKGAGYTISETQPVGTTDGIDTAGTLGGTAGNDVISAITFTTPGITGDNYNFGETLTAPAALSGFVFLDGNHDRTRNELTGRGGWTVELFRGAIGGAYTVLGSTVTAPDGSYSFAGLPAGPGYGVIFRSPDGNYVYGYLDGITLIANQTIVEQNEPIDPSGVVYDATTRLPVPGAVVTFNGPAGFNPALHLLGGTANQTQTTGPTGEYSFFLLPGAPAGVYTLSVTNPAGYLPGLAASIPACTATLNVGAVPNPSLVQASDFAPVAAIPVHNPNACPTSTATLAAGAGTTQYYMSFALNGASANVLNNQIPIEGLPTTGALRVTKSSSKTQVSRGELVPYTITVRNNVDLLHTSVSIVDALPPGFKYRTGSATIDGKRIEPTLAGRTLTWSGLTVGRGQTRTLKLLLVVGTGVGQAKYTNQAWTSDSRTGAVTSNIGKATVRVVADPTFDCSDIIGKVFDDRNRDGYQNSGERGIANVRLATVRGLLVKTDRYGRFHIACAQIPDEDRGSNFIMKLDTRTLPTGYRVTTENPRVIRLTRGKLAKLNFGAAIHRLIRIDVAGKAFRPGSTALRARWARAIDGAIKVMRQQKSVLRIGYRRSAREDRKLSRKRMSALVQRFRKRWRQVGGGYDLPIETEFYSKRRR